NLSVFVGEFLARSCRPDLVHVPDQRYWPALHRAFPVDVGTGDLGRWRAACLALVGRHADAADAEQANRSRCAAGLFSISEYKLDGMAARCEILGEDEELAFGLLQDIERLKRGPVDPKLNSVKIGRRLGEDRDNAGAEPVKGDTAAGAGALPGRNIFFVKNQVPVLVFDRINIRRVSPH